MKTSLTQYNTDSCIESAIVYAADSHHPQTDRNSAPYIFHPLRVMESVRADGYNLTYQIVAVLHDVVEDTGATLDEIETYFGKDIRDAVDALTRRNGEGYFSEYLPRVLENHIAKVIKYYDAQDNFNRGGHHPGESKKYAKVILRCIEAGVPKI